jgi:hypothetical protein
LGDPKFGRVVSGLVVLGLVLAGCKDTSPEPRGAPTSEPAPPPSVGPAVFAFAGANEFRLYRDENAIATIALGSAGGAGTGVRDAEWTADGTRLVLATDARLFSIDVATGAVQESDCTCDSVAVAAGKVFVLDRYGGTRLAVYDAATLAPAEPIEPDLGPATGLLRVDGAGERVVLFPIIADGARAQTEVVVLDPESGATTKVGDTGDTGAPAEAAFSARGWRGAPTFAYTTNGSTGAQSGNDSVVWFDPTLDEPEAVTDDAPLRDQTPDVPEDEWNNRWENLWWAADGTLHATGTTWQCTPTTVLDPPDCTDHVDHTQWRFDGTSWSEADGRSLTTVRDVGGVSLELSLPPDGVEDRELTAVRDGERTVLASDVRNVWTPPRSLTPPDSEDRPPPDVVVQYAPLVRLAKGDDHRPGSAEEFLAAAKLVWANDFCKDTTLAEEGEIDVDRLTTEDGYRHHATKQRPHVPLTCVNAEPEYDTLDPTRPFDESPDGPPGRQGFALDPKDDVHPGTELANGESPAPVYWQYQERKYVYYWFFYPYNDAPYKGFDHEGDWERISIRLTDANEPDRIVYSGHGHVCYRPWQDVTRSDGHPVVYSATGTHASYATADRHLLKHVKVKGRQLPVWDHTSEGTKWPTWQHLTDTDRSAWFGYAGAWGSVGNIADETGPVGPYPGRNLDEVRTDTRCE